MSEYFWSQKGIPHKGWTHIEVYDHLQLCDEYFICEMCGYERVRYVHVLYHEEYGYISVGCVCAGKMVGDIEYAKGEEKRFKDIQRKRKQDRKKEERRLKKEEEIRKKNEEIRKRNEELHLRLEQEAKEREENERKRLEELRIKREAYLWKDLESLYYKFNPIKKTYSARIHNEIVTIKLTVNGTYAYVFRNKWTWNLRTLEYAKERVREDLFKIFKEESYDD